LAERIAQSPLASGALRPVFDLEAALVVGFHDRFLGGRDATPQTGSSELWKWIEDNHHSNAALWREEDRARSTDVPDAEIVRCKRRIDALNQRRNDAVEALDACLLAALDRLIPEPASRLSSETAGAIIDRLSILALKIHHMRLQTRRVEAGDEHVQRCSEKLATLITQRSDLARCFDRLLREVRCGAAHFKTYRQFKMYNDPALNPELYRRRAASGSHGADAAVDVLIPTCERPAALAVTLTSLLAQTAHGLRIVVSDQGEVRRADASAEVQAVVRLLDAKGHAVELLRHLPRRGLAEQRHFLLQRSTAPYVLFLDDDVVVEADLVERLLRAIREQRCGFVGSALIGMSHVGNPRPHQQRIEFWDGPVVPEEVLPDSPAWARHELHNAANLYHLQTQLGISAADQRLYRVAWVGGCVLFDRAKLNAAGGFDFWHELSSEHCGEDVLAQLRARHTVGLCTPDAAPLERSLPYVPWQNERLRLLELVALAGARTTKLEPSLPVLARDETELADRLDLPSQPLAVLSPGATDARRRWSVERFAQVGDALARAGACVVVQGGPDEQQLSAGVVAAMRAPALDAGGRLTLGGLAALLGRARLVVATDSGPLHLAHAVGTPTVGVYWLKNLFVSAPLSAAWHRQAVSLRLHCPTCGAYNLHRRCEHDPSFVDDVDPAEIIELALALWHRTPPRPAGCAPGPGLY